MTTDPTTLATEAQSQPSSADNAPASVDLTGSDAKAADEFKAIVGDEPKDEPLDIDAVLATAGKDKTEAEEDGEADADNKPAGKTDAAAEKDEDDKPAKDTATDETARIEMAQRRARARRALLREGSRTEAEIDALSPKALLEKGEKKAREQEETDAAFRDAREYRKLKGRKPVDATSETDGDTADGSSQPPAGRSERAQESGKRQGDPLEDAALEKLITETVFDDDARDTLREAIRTGGEKARQAVVKQQAELKRQRLAVSTQSAIDRLSGDYPDLRQFDVVQQVLKVMDEIDPASADEADPVKIQKLMGIAYRELMKDREERRITEKVLTRAAKAVDGQPSAIAGKSRGTKPLTEDDVDRLAFEAITRTGGGAEAQKKIDKIRQAAAV